MSDRHITISIGDLDAPEPTTWALIRGSIGLLLIIGAFAIGTHPPTDPSRTGAWLLTFVILLGLGATIAAFELWLHRRQVRRLRAAEEVPDACSLSYWAVRRGRAMANPGDLMNTLSRLMAWFIHCREVASRRAAETREIIALDRGKRTVTEPVGPFTEDN